VSYGGPYGLKHVVFIDNIIKSLLCLTIIDVNMSRHNGMDSIKISNTLSVVRKWLELILYSERFLVPM
jgi:hypothetical protein